MSMLGADGEDASRPGRGAAIGTATLAAIFYHVLVRTGHDYSIAVSDALLAASGFMLLALLMALTELRRRWHRPQRPALTDGRLHPLP
jgi:hypothetical protein